MVLAQGQINEYVGFTQDCIDSLQSTKDAMTARLDAFKQEYGNADAVPKKDISTLSDQELGTRRIALSKLKAEVDNAIASIEKNLREVDKELVKRK